MLVSIPLPLVYPLAQKRLSGFFGAFTRTFGLIAQAARIDCGAGQLTGMSDEPSFQLIRIDLWMELQCQHMIAHAECLVRGHGGGGQQFSTFGQIKRISVPMQDRTVTIEKTQRRLSARFGEFHAAPADFLALAGV